MTDTKTPSPSDAEIVALLGDPKYSTIGAVREAVARWGQPQAVAGGEPVAHEQGCPAIGGYGNGVEPCCCGAAPPPQAVQEQLTDEQINAAAEVEDNDSAFLAGFHGGARFAEAAHGIIKGGQHGAE